MKILANDGLSKAGVQRLEEAGHTVITDTVAQEDLAKYINDNDIVALIVRSATKVRKDVIDACPNLKVIARAGVGMDNIDVAYARSVGRTVLNTPNASSSRGKRRSRCEKPPSRRPRPSSCTSRRPPHGARSAS